MSRERVGLVGCVKLKLPHPARAGDLYTSQLFRGRRSYVERSCDRWFVLSAEHGLVDPDAVLAPYDVTLSDASRAEKRAWSERVVETLVARLGSFDNLTFEVHAGANYRDYGLVSAIHARAGRVDIPAEHMTQGQQLRFYAGYALASVDLRQVVDTETPKRVRPLGDTTMQEPTGIYRPVFDFLHNQRLARVTIKFADLETIVGRRLPASARNHRAWWANDATHSQAVAWLAAGWTVAAVDAPRSVTFQRVRG